MDICLCAVVSTMVLVYMLAQQRERIELYVNIRFSGIIRNS